MNPNALLAQAFGVSMLTVGLAQLNTLLLVLGGACAVFAVLLETAPDA